MSWFKKYPLFYPKINRKTSHVEQWSPLGPCQSLCSMAILVLLDVSCVSIYLFLNLTRNWKMKFQLSRWLAHMKSLHMQRPLAYSKEGSMKAAACQQKVTWFADRATGATGPPLPVAQPEFHSSGATRFNLNILSYRTFFFFLKDLLFLYRYAMRMYEREGEDVDWGRRGRGGKSGIYIDGILHR